MLQYIILRIQTFYNGKSCVSLTFLLIDRPQFSTATYGNTINQLQALQELQYQIDIQTSEGIGNVLRDYQCCFMAVHESIKELKGFKEMSLQVKVMLHRLIVVSLIIIQKGFAEEQHTFQTYSLLTGITIKDLVTLEKRLLDHLQFQIIPKRQQLEQITSADYESLFNQPKLPIFNPPTQ